MGFDLASITAEETATVEIVHPSTGVATGAKITVYGQDSEVFRSFARKQTNKRLEKMRRNQKGMTAEASEEEALDLLVACTKTWEGIVDKGKPIDCTPENVREVYKKIPWIKEQVDEGIADRSLFIRA